MDGEATRGPRIAEFVSEVKAAGLKLVKHFIDLAKRRSILPLKTFSLFPDLV
jgi:hypothetical protein